MTLYVLSCIDQDYNIIEQHIEPTFSVAQSGMRYSLEIAIADADEKNIEDYKNGETKASLLLKDGRRFEWRITKTDA